MKLKDWYSARGPKFIYQRGCMLLARYNLSARKSMDRIDQCVAQLSRYGCSPTFPIPGILVERYPRFVRHLQDEGAEIAVHGYQHINLNTYPLEDVRRQLERAVLAFERMGIQAHGFRCPYIHCSEELLNSLPSGLFRYSSNQAVHWPVTDSNVARKENLFYNTLGKFYQAKDSAEVVSVPQKRINMLEIPVCIPDDMQLLDGLNLGIVGLTQVWKQTLLQTYQRGELFTLLFHTELVSLDDQPLIELLCAAQAYQPPVWVARLCEISDWWEEKSAFRVEVVEDLNMLHLSFKCSPRGTILARGIEYSGSSEVWEGGYRRLQSQTINIQGDSLPFVGLPGNVSESIVSFLHDQGYILEIGEKANRCTIFLDQDTIASFANNVQLVNYIETSNAPLVRFWRWPDGAKSALSITGDLDALSLRDYVSRLFFS